MDYLERLEQLASLGDEQALDQIKWLYRLLEMPEKLRALGELHWYIFRDNHTLGYQKTPWSSIWIEALNQDEAVEIFKEKIGRNPYYWSCTDLQCCRNPDYIVFDAKSLTPDAYSSEGDRLFPNSRAIEYLSKD